MNVFIEQKLEIYRELRSFYGISGIDNSEENLRTSRSTEAPFVKTVEKVIRLENEIDELTEKYVRLKSRLIEEIHNLCDTRYVVVLYKRYMEFKRFEDIAAEMHYTYDYIRKMHGKALRAFENEVLREKKE